MAKKEPSIICTNVYASKDAEGMRVELTRMFVEYVNQQQQNTNIIYYGGK